MKNFLQKIENRFQVDISILILLCVVAQHSFFIKFFGIFLLILLNWRTFSKINILQIPFFYTIIPSLEILKFFLLDPNFSLGHIAQFVVGMVYWIASIICFYVVFVKVKKEHTTNIENVLVIFTLINFALSIFQLLQVCFIEGVINPYDTGHELPYGISTGDLIKGFLNNLQITNGFVSILLTLFFAHNKRIVLMLMALIPFLLSGSNYISIVFLFALGVYFIFSKDKKYAFTISLFNTVLLVLFYVFVTPLNGIYTYAKVRSILYNKPIESELMLSKKYAQSVRSHQNDTQNVAKQINDYKLAEVSGKKIAYSQTIELMKKSPKYFLFGTGIGGFSSNIAFNFSGIVDNSAMNKLFPQYETENFAQNHKRVYRQMKSMNMIFHSESNKPFSFYNQLLGEYGIIGFLIFFIFYIGYFLKRIKITGYTFAILTIFLFSLNLYYYLELLNIFLFFEVLMFLNIVEKKQIVNV